VPDGLPGFVADHAEALDWEPDLLHRLHEVASGRSSCSTVSGARAWSTPTPTPRTSWSTRTPSG
jgi:hypothetical protein